LRILIYGQISKPTPLEVDWSHGVFASIAALAVLEVVICELATPIALFVKKLRLPVIGFIFLMQIGTLLFMGDGFRQFMALYLFWVPWSRFLKFPVDP
tara:strand:+ start:1943 stop:2236 length:294 start_codon:yes stop_codon:yes gene_type:complete